ncbi:KPN_02809 family neutral zinc metallopeptidase [Peptoniphilus mikwangii]|uniref:KPN_02809 family neutral zinc metallopeptidase n=1 Tax=Peptoniphilus mikwangii TaxID=1354300 RepID=UPI00040332D6|nr:neutral zinc metallopeptidase [Peptoniphilus mikwangii]
MKWQGRKENKNVIKGSRVLTPLGGVGLLILMIIFYLLGGNPLEVLNNTDSSSISIEENTEVNKKLENFLSVILTDTTDIWNEIFNRNSLTYREPKLVLYNSSIQSKCGNSTSNMGPFYCPKDESIYIDVSFYNDLKSKYNKLGEFSFAYVLAHEVGHHVQKQLGTLEQVYELKNQLPEKEFNKYIVKLELQADYFAGVFAHYVQNAGYLKEDDIKDIINATTYVGYDRIQQQTVESVIPDTFTYGTSEQRIQWFKKGLKYGDINHENIFNDSEL